MLFFLDTGSADAVRALAFLEGQRILFVNTFDSMKLFFEDRIRLDCLKFGLKVANGMTVRATIGSTTGVGEIIAVILGLIAWGAPVTLG